MGEVGVVYCWGNVKGNVTGTTYLTGKGTVSKSKGNTNTTTPTPTTAAAVVVPTTAATPVRRGTSTVATPVALVWVTCINMCTPGGVPVSPTPTRGALMAAVIGLGVTYYTARTQVNAYLKASAKGTTTPTNLPRGVSVPW